VRRLQTTPRRSSSATTAFETGRAPRPRTWQPDSARSKVYNTGRGHPARGLTLACVGTREWDRPAQRRQIPCQPPYSSTPSPSNTTSSTALTR
jgi:hypothetical protein